MTITPADVRSALALPPTQAPARRLPKDVLAQHGAANAADRKLIDSAIERLDWWATLSPATIGVSPGTDTERPVPAIQLLALTARGEPTQRLLTLIHRAIPVPVILLTALPGDAGTRITLGPLRRAERVADQMVVERLVAVPDIASPDEETVAEFLSSLSIAALPRTTLAAIYDALIERAEALRVSRIVDAPYLLPQDATAAGVRREALARYAAVESDWLAARAVARREKRLAEQVVLGNRARALKDRMQAIAGELAEAPGPRP